MMGVRILVCRLRAAFFSVHDATSRRPGGLGGECVDPLNNGRAFPANGARAERYRCRERAGRDAAIDVGAAQPSAGDNFGKAKDCVCHVRALSGLLGNMAAFFGTGSRVAG
jgi:hypothetical protein